MINSITEAPNKWQDYESIYINQSFVPGKTIDDINSKRLVLISKRISQNPDKPHGNADERTQLQRLRIAVEQLVTYSRECPDSEISTVIFNCPEHSYFIFYGMLMQQMNIICLIVGKHIPKYAMQ